MAGQEFYAFDGGIVSVAAAESRKGLSLQIDTVVPGAKFRMRGNAVFDDAGLVSFAGEATASTGSMILNAKRQAEGLEVKFTASGVHGSIFFDDSGYDLTSLDLMVLE